ncbi:Cytochrome C oxidase, mono-heme subunit/FixO [compost metagenome]
MRTIGVPYEEGYENQANLDLDKQAKRIADNLNMEGIEVAPETEIIALIAYLQRLGIDIKSQKVAESNTNQK